MMVLCGRLKRKELRRWVRGVQGFRVGRQQQVMAWPAIFNRHVQSQLAIHPTSCRCWIGFQQQLSQSTGCYETRLLRSALVTQDKMDWKASVQRLFLKDPAVCPAKLV